MTLSAPQSVISAFVHLIVLRFGALFGQIHPSAPSLLWESPLCRALLPCRAKPHTRKLRKWSPASRWISLGEQCAASINILAGLERASGLSITHAGEVVNNSLTAESLVLCLSVCRRPLADNQFGSQRLGSQVPRTSGLTDAASPTPHPCTLAATDSVATL